MVVKISTMEKKYVVRVGQVVGSLLLVALVCNFTVEGWQWGVLDFVAMGVLMSGAGLALAYVLTVIRPGAWRIVAALLVVVLFLMVWTELAVDAVSQLLVWLLS